MPNEQAASAILAIFPTLKSYNHFTIKKQNNRIISSLSAFAYRHHLIESDSEKLLKNFIEIHALNLEEHRPPSNMNFEFFFDQKESLIDLNLSTRAMTERINSFIQKHQVELPKVSNSMLTRLKNESADTFHKQNVLRSLAFWMGYTRPHKALCWNYETLYQLCSEDKHSQDHKEGARIGFALFSRGEVIDHETIGWLKRNIKSYIEESIRHFSYDRWGKIHSHDITTHYLDLPKEDSIASPSAYRKCLQAALSLAHQICLRWALSSQHTQNRFLSIGIALGEYCKLDKHLYPILTAKIPADPTIRLTDYTRQCILINGIPALPCSTPIETSLFSGETITIWWIAGIWSTLYFDFIPDLLADRKLSGIPSKSSLTPEYLWSPEIQDSKMDKTNKPNAISTFFKFPQNALLGIEIAKTLYYRLRFWDALEIIRIVLSLNPTNITARTLRMTLLNNLAIHAPSYAIAQDLFAKAHNEAFFIQKNCSFHAEIFYYGHAWVYATQAMLDLRHLRNNQKNSENNINKKNIKRQIFSHLEKADSLFSMGEMVSSSGMRAYYLQNNTKIIMAILNNNDKLFRDPDEPIDANPEIIRKSTREFQWQSGYFGYYQPKLSLDSTNDLKIKMSKNDYLIRKDSITLPAYKPTFYFGSATALWDFFPMRTVETAKTTLQLLRKASQIAETLSRKHIGIYSVTRTYGEMLPAEEFMDHLDKAIEMVKHQSGQDLNKRSDSEVIYPKNPHRLGLLSTLNF